MNLIVGIGAALLTQLLILAQLLLIHFKYFFGSRMSSEINLNSQRTLVWFIYKVIKQ